MNHLTTSDLMQLSDEELLKISHSDDDITLRDEATNLLLSRYKEEVRKITRAYFLIGSDQQDLLQEGMIGLYKAALSYKQENGSFQNFARVCITRQLTSAIRASQRHKHKPLNTAVSLDRPVVDEDGEERSMIDLLPDLQTKSPEEQTMESEEEAAMQRRIESLLSSMERKVLALYLEGNDYQEIARKLEISSKSADNAIQRIRRKVRRAFK